MAPKSSRSSNGNHHNRKSPETASNTSGRQAPFVEIDSFEHHDSLDGNTSLELGPGSTGNNSVGKSPFSLEYDDHLANNTALEPGQLMAGITSLEHDPFSASNTALERDDLFASTTSLDHDPLINDNTSLNHDSQANGPNSPYGQNSAGHPHWQNEKKSYLVTRPWRRGNISSNHHKNEVDGSPMDRWVQEDVRNEPWNAIAGVGEQDEEEYKKENRHRYGYGRLSGN